MTEIVRVSWPKRWVTGSALFVIALGIAVLTGWSSHILALVQILPQLPPMTRNAALCFVLCGLILLMVTHGTQRWLVVACAGTVSVIGVVTIVELVLGVNAGIDELLGPSYITIKLSSPGRMSPASAMCFALSAIGLVMAPPPILSTRSALPLVLSGSMIAAVGMATSMSFALGSSDAFGWGNLTRQAVHTGVGLGVLGFGMLALAWHIEQNPSGTPRWLPGSVALGVVTGAVGWWQAPMAAATSFSPSPRLLCSGPA